MSSTTQQLQTKPGTWDLSFLHTSIDDPKIDKTWESVDKKCNEFLQKYRGKIESNDLTANTLLNGIKDLENLCIEMSKPIHYAELLFAADTSNPQHGAFVQAQMEQATMARVKLMFFELELQKVSEEIIQKLLKDPLLKEYKHYIETIRIYTPYTLSETEEIILEETANTGCRAWVRLFEELTSNHTYKLKRPGSDKYEECSQEQVLKCLREPNRELRQAAADAFTQGLTELQKTITYIYNILLQDKSVGDRLRKHPYAEHSRHLSNELDKKTVDLVVGLCKEKGQLVERYYNVKREIMGLPELTHIDRYAPIKEAESTMNYGEATELVLNSFGECHEILEEKGKEFFDKNWIDAEPRQGKRGGAFCSYITPDTHPVILMSYLDKLSDVKTLAHELGHGVHASLSREQSYFNFHGTLPLAELASTFGEMLVFEKLTSKANDEDQLALYAEKIEEIFATVYRQASMFRFEQRCHNKRREEGELTLEEFCQIWQEEQQSMFGSSVKLGEQHEKWWLYVGHFFFAPFYVYAYSFGELLALSIYQQYKKSGKEFADKYIEVLKLGGSQTPQELMGHLDIDLTSREFWEGGFNYMETLIAKFEQLWNKAKS